MSLSRREFIKLGAGLAMAPIIGCSSRPEPGATIPAAKPATKPVEPKPQIYHGALQTLEGKPLLPDQKFKELTGALYSSDFPLLQKIASDLNKLRAAKSVPAEFPRWVHGNTYPLVVTRDSTPTSLFAVSFESSSESNRNFEGYEVQKNEPFKDEVFGSMRYGIHLGLPINISENGPLAEGLFLAKEHLSAMMAIKMGQGFYDFTQKWNWLSFQETNGAPILDRERQLRIGASLFFRELLKQSSDYWKIIDVLPVLYLGAAFDYLIQKGKYPERSRGLGHLYRAVNNLADDKDAANAIRDLINEWVTSDSMLLPDGILDQASRNPIASAVFKLHEGMYGAK